MVTVTGSSFLSLSPSLSLSLSLSESFLSLSFASAFFLSSVLPLSSSFLLVGLLVGYFFVVALRFHGIGIGLFQHHGINAARNRMLKSGKIEPGNAQSHIRAGREEEIFAALVEYRIARVAQPIRDLRCSCAVSSE